MMLPLPGVAPDLRSILSTIAGWFDSTPETVRHVAVRLLATWVLIWVGWQLVKLVSRRIVAVADDHADGVSFREKRAQTLAQLLRSVGWGVLAALGVILTLREVIDITPVLGLSAAAALAVSFGAQSLIKDYFAGFFILFESQFVVGDAIEAAGKSGTVERLTLRTVRIRDLDGAVHIIPNGQITTLTNKTRGWSRAVVDVGVSYDNDIDAVIALLNDEAKKFDADHAWAGRRDAASDVLGVESFGDNGVTMRVLLRTKPGAQGEVAREFRRRIVVRLEKEGIKGARSQQNINIYQAAAAPPAAPPADGPLPGMS